MPASSTSSPIITSGASSSSLKEIGELDNTLIMVVSDNGASSEAAGGSLNEVFFFNNTKESLDNLKNLDKLGGVESCNHYPWGWTNAGNSPFRR